MANYDYAVLLDFTHVGPRPGNPVNKGKVIPWLEENTKGPYTFELGYLDGPYHQSCTLFQFADEDDAILFKLVYAEHVVEWLEGFTFRYWNR